MPYSQTEIARKLLLDIGNKLVDTYTDIYIYVLRIIIQYGRSTPLQKLRNIVGADDWKARWENIESASSQIDNDVRTHATARGFDMLQTMGCIRIEIEVSYLTLGPLWSRGGLLGRTKMLTNN